MVWVLRQAVRGAWSKKSELEEIEQDLDLNHAAPCAQASQTERLEQDVHEEATRSEGSKCAGRRGLGHHGLGKGS